MLKLQEIYFRLYFILFAILFSVIIVEIYYIKKFELLVMVIAATFLLFLVILHSYLVKITNIVNQEVFKIISFLKNLTKKEKETYISSDFSKEFKDITKLLTKISNILIKQERHKNLYTAKLELSNTQKDEIISAISHEFKNPIAVINGYSQTLLDDNLPSTLRKKFLLKIYKNGVKLTNLIDTLRLAIKLDENKQKINFKKVDIYLLTKEIIEDIKDSYNREIKLFGDKIEIEADEVLLGVAIRNLIENAIKYSEDEILVMVTNNSISVIDRGVGISKENIEKITQKFYRVSNNSWNNSLGLGLSIVSNIVKLHDFSLEIKSEVNKGSEFIIKF